MWNLVLCALSLAYPLVAAHRASTPDSLERWRAYLVCSGLLVLPVLTWPWWLPMRTELVSLVTLFLGAHDARGAHAFYVRYVVPVLRPWIERDVPSWNELFAAVESVAGRHVSAGDATVAVEDNAVEDYADAEQVTEEDDVGDVGDGDDEDDKTEAPHTS